MLTQHATVLAHHMVMGSAPFRVMETVTLELCLSSSLHAVALSDLVVFKNVDEQVEKLAAPV